MQDNMGDKSWEEEIYWKRFHTMHFYQFLPSDFRDHLVLPAKFAEHMSSKLPQKVSLIGPSGAAWDVEISSNGGLAFIGDGWKCFVKAYALEENCLLLFKCKDDSCFEILIFDQESLCEKETAYFVPKCSGKKCDQKISCKRSVSKVSSTEVLEDTDTDGVSEFVSTKKAKKDVVKEVVCEGHRVNAEAQIRCASEPSDASSEGYRNDHDVVGSNKPQEDFTAIIISGKQLSPQGPGSWVSETAAAHAEKPNENNTAMVLSEKSDMEQIPLLSNDQMEVTISSDIITNVITADNGRSYPEKKSTEKSGKRRRRLVKLAHLTSALTPPFNKEKPSENSVAEVDNEKSDMKQRPFLKNGQMKVSEAVTLAIPYESDISSDGMDTKVVTVDDGKCHVDMKHILKYARRRGARVKRAHPSSAKGLAFGRASVTAEKLCDNNTSAELCQNSDMEPTALRNGSMVVTERATLATPCNFDVSADAMFTKVVMPDKSKCQTDMKKTPKPGRKSSGQVRQALPTSAKRFTSNKAMDYISNRRAVTESEKLDAMRRANEALTEKSFMVVMRPTCCYKRFFMNIPGEWMHQHLPRHDKEVILRFGEKTWRTTFKYYDQRSYGGFTARWKAFVWDNNLEEYDVCVFKLASEQDDDLVVFDVKIFRVVQEISPLSRA